ncbi:MAG: hypothetical protein HZB33_07275 [Nitrospirae bacterium]|nr:hypothetical protein [Nitrospirota bacterium]
MMKIISAVCLSIVFLPSFVFAFDFTGLKPIAPDGVFSTFSTESLPKRSIAVDLSAERSNHPKFNRFGLTGAFGLTDSIELSFVVPYITRYENSIEGAEDMSLGFKHRFYEEGKYGPSLAYMAHVSFNNGADQFSTQGRLGVGFIASKRVGPFKGHVNLKFEKPLGDALKNEVTLSAGIDLSAANNFNLLGELIVMKRQNSKEFDYYESRLGYRIRTTDYLFTTVGVGLNLKRTRPEYKFMVSVTVTSPHHRKEIKRIYEEE